MKRIVKQMLVLLALSLAATAALAAAPAATGGLGEIGADGMPMLARTSNCSACHIVGNEKKMLGPSWMVVSRKYKESGSYEFAGKKYPVAEGLILKVSKGGAGVWGTMPMPANSPMVKDEDIKVLVEYIVGLSK